MATAKQIDHAISKMEDAATTLLMKAERLPVDCQHWQRRDLLAAAREYARTVSRVTRVRLSR